MFEFRLAQAAHQRVAVDTFKYVLTRGAPLVLALFLFGVNNLAIVSGWLNPPEGYVPAYVVRAGDMAQYLTWLGAFQHQGTIPNYHAPWQTEPALFNPLLWLLARACQFLGLGLAAGYHALHFLFYVIAAYSLRSALQTFMKTPGQVWAALLAIFCSVPLQSLAIVPAAILTRDLGQQPGIGDFVWWSSDGFFHGISGSLLVTAGTATTLLAFGLLAKYLDQGQRRYLVYASLAVFFSALIHPFEVFVIGSAGAATLLWRRGRLWVSAIPEVSILGLASFLGLLPYIFLSLRHQWLRDVAETNKWHPGSPIKVLVMLGLPAILALALFAARSRMAAKTDLLLCSWFICSLVGIYVPWIPWSQHLLDGFLYAVGMLLVRQASHSNFVELIRRSYPRLALVMLMALFALSLTAYVTFHFQSFRDGNAVKPSRLFSSVVSKDELGVLSWLKNNAQPDRLVLGPQESAAWLATVPMHSFASHSVFSLTYEKQAKLAEEFYLGRMDATAARRALEEYGVCYVVAPEQSPANKYLDEAEKKDKFGSLVIYELRGNAMKPYPGMPRAGNSAFASP